MPVKIIDSTTIELCLSLFPWARMVKVRAAVKLNLELSLSGNIPSFFDFSPGTDKGTGVWCDQTIVFAGYYPAHDYPEKLRRIKYYDQDTARYSVFLTNDFNLEAATPTLLYKQVSLADRVILQMGEVTLKHQVLLGAFRERGEDPNLYCIVHLPVGCYTQEALGDCAQLLRNSTDFEASPYLIKCP